LARHECAGLVAKRTGEDGCHREEYEHGDQSDDDPERADDEGIAAHHRVRQPLA